MRNLFLEREAMTWLTPTSTWMIVTTQIIENDRSSLIVWGIYVKNSLPPQLAANQSTIIMFTIKFSQHWIFVVNSLLKNGWVWPLFPSISAGWKSCDGDIWWIIFKLCLHNFRCENLSTSIRSLSLVFFFTCTRGIELVPIYLNLNHTLS